MLFTAILKRKMNFVANFVVHLSGKADAAWAGELFQARGYVDAISENIAISIDNDVTEVDPNPEKNFLAGLPRRVDAEQFLDFHCRPHGSDSAWELGEHPVSGRSHHPPPVVGDPGLYLVPHEMLHEGEGAFLVPGH
ncbi:hypothetical protein MAXJ12_29370 [Mesorhizobium alhagi CCNWXJ12-2]|uniref:Uncharacterized protein n=1 Tax=Mesorhizobium alhagi CCNWXJ12-2 TaxID=1107882 RepID=H0I087_9HYPH|nr:hypothetical protein MAXJ12_29370 [Mesorhizobium alhagi CCNWXJ12-2]